MYRDGPAKTPILIIVGIVGLSVVFFFLFSAPTCSQTPSGGSLPDGTKPGQTPAATRPSPKPAETKVVTAPKPKPAPAFYSTPEQLLEAIGQKLREGNLEAAMKIAGTMPGTGPRAEFLKHLITTAGWAVPAEGLVWRDAGVMSAVTRHELVLRPADSATSPAPKGGAFIDVERIAGEGCKAKAFHFDDALITQTLELLRVKAIVLDDAALREPPDSLAQSRNFLATVLARDFKSARNLTAGANVTHEKLAGLCIAFEEGAYRMAEKRPLVVTATAPGTAWAIARLRSDSRNIDSEIGLEMKDVPGRGWMIDALDLNKMLESYVQGSGAGKVFYSPIVKSPGGGESIVVYFEFDKAELHPRALAQLDIIAGLLQSDPARRMRITGHADSVGRDDYNYKLSQARAANVREQLLRLGVAAQQIETLGFGATAPLDPNRRDDGSDNPEGRSRNRRTEIYLDF